MTGITAFTHHFGTTMINVGRGESAIGGVMANTTILRRGNVIQRHSDGARRCVGAIVAGGAIPGNAFMIKVRCWLKRDIGVTDATVLLCRDMRDRSIDNAGGKASVMAPRATAGYSAMGCCQEHRRRETTGICAVMTHTAIFYSRKVINSFSHGNTAIMALGAMVVIYAQVVEAGTCEAGKAAGMAVRAIARRWQVIDGLPLADFAVVTGRTVGVNAVVTEVCVDEIRRGMTDGTLLSGWKMNRMFADSNAVVMAGITTANIATSMIERTR